jgi:SAM-dependent methyltransferase
MGSDAKSSLVNRRTYDEIASAYHAETKDPRHSLPWIEAFEEVLVPGAYVGDLGSGPGRDAATLRARGFRVISMDLSLGMLRAGLEDFPGPRVQSDLRCLPFADEVFDAVWANACLLHLMVEELPRALREVARTLRPSGHLHLSFKKGEGSEWESARYGKPRWFQFWNEAALDVALDEAGFRNRMVFTDDLRTQTWIIRQVQKRT